MNTNIPSSVTNISEPPKSYWLIFAFPVLVLILNIALLVSHSPQNPFVILNVVVIVSSLSIVSLASMRCGYSLDKEKLKFLSWRTKFQWKEIPIEQVKGFHIFNRTSTGSFISFTNQSGQIITEQPCSKSDVVRAFLRSVGKTELETKVRRNENLLVLLVIIVIILLSQNSYVTQACPWLKDLFKN